MIPRRLLGWRALLLAAAAICAAPAQASLPGLDELATAGPAPATSLQTELTRELPGPCEGEQCGELEAPQPKTRLRGFELDLYCRLGGEQGLSCRPRQVWLEEYGEGTSDRLVYAKARYFDPELGRFLSQDSYLGELTDPPSLHRYLYAADRPTYYVDPTGHFNAVGDYANTGWGQAANTAANWGWEFYKGAWGLGANIYTLGAFGEAKAAHDRGDSAAAGAAAGVLNTLSLGGAKGAVNSYVEGKNEAAGYIEGVADTFLPISERRVLMDPNASGWEKAQAVATGATKLATLGLAANAAMPGAKAAATPVAEARTAAVAEPLAELPAARAPAGLLPAAEPAGGARFIVDASGNVQDAMAARGRMNPIGSQGPIELGPVTITDPRRLLPAGSLDDAIAANYQRYYTEAGRDVVRGFNRGNIKVPVGTNWEQILGGRIDSIARARLRNFLAREGIAEGPAADVAVNRWLRDPSGSGAYRIPDVLLRNSRRILDGTIGSKTQATPQVQDFGAFSGGYDVEIVRPDIAPFRR